MPRDFVGLVNTTLKGRYTAEQEIGRGGSALIFRARDPGGRIVALKVLRPELLVSVEADRFLREIRLASTLQHPHIAPLLDSGSVEWVIYYVMAYIEGPTLRQALAERSPLDIPQATRISLDLLGALDHAHARGIVHRDVKPDNIVLSPEQGAVLLDFGIARAMEASGESLTAAGIAIGTVSYMSPEQVMGVRSPDPRSDIYALGCVLYECLTGTPPFTHASDPVVMQMHVRDVPRKVRDRRAEVPEALDAVIMRALAKRPEERWASAEEMRGAVEKAVGR
jgi:serine/threonine-protein kinase